jgi:hypothetical protein
MIYFTSYTERGLVSSLIPCNDNNEPLTSVKAEPNHPYPLHRNCLQPCLGHSFSNSIICLFASLRSHSIISRCHEGANTNIWNGHPFTAPLPSNSRHLILVWSFIWLDDPDGIPRRVFPYSRLSSVTNNSSRQDVRWMKT